jgi:hypothetical protein
MTDLRRVAADIEILSRAALTPWPPKEAQMDESGALVADRTTRPGTRPRRRPRRCESCRDRKREQLRGP